MMTLIQGSKKFEVYRHNSRSCVAVIRKSGGAATMTGQDAEDFLDQLTHCTDFDHLCQGTVEDDRWKVTNPSWKLANLG